MSNEELEILEKYLGNELSDEEVEAFEQRMLADEALAEAVQDYIHAQAAIYAGGQHRMAAELNELGQELRKRPPSASKRAFSGRYALLLAAVVTLLLVIGGLLYFSGPTSPQALFAEAFEMPKSPGSRIIEQDSLWLAGVRAYTAKDYTQAINLWKQLPASVQSSETHFYLGICYLKNQQTQEAAAAFERVNTGSTLKAQAEWYTALVYLQAGDKEKAEQALQAIISQPNHPKKSQVEDLMQKLEQL